MGAVTSDRDRQFSLFRELSGFLFAALVLRALFWWGMGRVIDSADATRYLEMARNLAIGEGHIDPRIPVLYPLLTGLVYQIFPDIEFAGRLISLLAGTALIAPAYFLTRDLFGLHAARVAALIVTVWPWLLDYSSRETPDALAAALWFTALLLLSRGIRQGGGYLYAAPLAFLMLHLARPEGVFLWLTAPAAALLLAWKGPRGAPLRLGLFIVFSILVAITGVLLIGGGAGQGAGVARIGGAPGLERMLTEHGAGIAKTFAVFTGNLLPVMVGPFLLIFAGVGLFRPARHGRDLRLEFFVLLFAAIQFSLAILSAYADPRYIMAVVIAVSLWSARGLAIVTEQACAVSRSRLLRAAPVTALLLLMAIGAAAAIAPEHTGARPSTPREYKIVGRWMKENLEPGLIFCRKPQVGFYAGMPSTGPAQNDTLQEAVARAREAGAVYLVMDERHTAALFPQLRPLLDPTQAPPGLELLQEGLSPYPGAKVVVYRIVAP